MGSSEIRKRKWTLFTLTLVAMIVQIVITILAVNIIDDLAKPNNIVATNDEWEAAKKQAKTIVIAQGVVSLLFQLLGLIGSYKENYCLTLTYAILMTLATLGSIYSAIEASAGWATFALYLAITILAYLFARDIKRIRLTQTAPSQPGWTA